MSTKTDGYAFEATSAIAAMIASHCDGLRGTTLRNFLPRLVSELVPGSYRLLDMDMDGAIAPIADTDVPFLSPPNKPWPNVLKQIEGVNAADLNLPHDKERVGHSLPFRSCFSVSAVPPPPSPLLSCMQFSDPCLF